MGFAVEEDRRSLVPSGVASAAGPLSTPEAIFRRPTSCFIDPPRRCRQALCRLRPGQQLPAVMRSVFVDEHSANTDRPPG